MADSIIDTSLARALAEAKASGVAPAKGTPEGDALRRAAKRVDPRGAIAKAAKADYRARSGYGTTDADRLTDARIATRVRRAFSPVATEAAKANAAKYDPALAGNIAAVESTRAATRAELVRGLPATASKAIADMNSQSEVDECPLCAGAGFVEPATLASGLTPSADACGTCGGMGLIATPSPDSDDEIAAAVSKARSIKKLAKRLVRKAGGPDARTMAKSSAAAGHGTVLAIDESRKAKALSPRERQILRREAAKRLGIPAGSLKVEVR
jgi:hypothetical protein